LTIRLYRASRKPADEFDPLDASASVARDGWRWNDNRTEILYAASVEALAILEVVTRPGWDTVDELVVAPIDVPDGSVVSLDEAGIVLPSNWNQRPAAPNARSIGREFRARIDRHRAAGGTMCGLRVPSVISASDHNVLLDPRQKSSYAVGPFLRIPFDWLRSSST
jgi:RES domain-containing protein